MTRRQALAFGAGATAFLTVAISVRLATPAEADAEIAKFTGGKALEKGKITIDLPEIAENGNTVPLSVTIDSPMTADSYISEMLVVADGNPRPGVARFSFSPLSGRADGRRRASGCNTTRTSSSSPRPATASSSPTASR